MSSVLTVPVSQRDHIAGPTTAIVTLLEYGDYQCPHCGMAHPVVKQIRRSPLGRWLRFAYRHFPLTTIHPFAEPAAEAAEAAGEQGLFWDIHDLLFENQERLDPDCLLEFAAALELDVPRFTQELSARRYAPRVREDFMSGVRSGVNGTPTFFVNGVRHDGSYDFESLSAAIESAIAELSAER
jgi:protein-disulfide isomerase